MSKEQRFKARNAHVRKLFYDYQKKHQKWRIECVIELVAQKVFLSERTVEAIISHEGIYSEKPTTKKSDPNQISMFD